jgi:aldose 1-epimerase
LVRHTPWHVVEQDPDRLVQRVVVPQQPGWPGTLQATITHRVDENGLQVEVEATNIGERPVPYGYGAHPYFTVGEQRVDDVTLTIPADSYLAVDDRLLPIDVVPVDGTSYDWRQGRPLGATVLDTAFTGLARDADGRWQVTLSRADRTVGVWSDDSTSWVQVFTGGPYRTISIAVEPMTCGPDAFNPGPTRAQLIVLRPGESTQCRWGVTDLSERSR